MDAKRRKYKFGLCESENILLFIALKNPDYWKNIFPIVRRSQTSIKPESVHRELDNSRCTLSGLVGHKLHQLWLFAGAPAVAAPGQGFRPLPEYCYCGVWSVNHRAGWRTHRAFSAGKGSQNNSTSVFQYIFEGEHNSIIPDNTIIQGKKSRIG